MNPENAEVALLRGEPSDRSIRRDLVDVLARAFLENPMNRAFHRGSEGARLRANRAGLRSLVLDCERITKTWVVRSGHRVLGGLVETPPEAMPLPRPQVQRLLEGLLFQGPKALAEWGRLNEELKGIRPVLDCVTISVLGIDPNFWNQGLGGRLLDPVINAAQATGTPIYLESDRLQSIAFYRSRDFFEVGRVRLSGIDCVGLLRRADSSSNSDADSVLKS